MPNNNRPFLVDIMRYATYIALLSPLYISGKFFFPYVGPKGLIIMGAAQIVFFLWLFLAYHHKKYRPKLNWVTIGLLIFFGIMIISAITGVDPARSFWSKYERMTGVLVWAHLLGFFIAASSTFSEKDWKKIFTFSVGVATVVGVLFLVYKLPGEYLSKLLQGKNGVTLGNSSFLGTYLLFNAYLVILLGFHSERLKKYLTGVAFIIIAGSLLLSPADAARWSFVAGLGLLGLLYLLFEAKRMQLRALGGAGIIGGIVGVPLAVFYPQSPLHKWLISGLGKARFIVWGQAWEAFKARPILGWGQENFIIAFSKHFNPELLTTGAAEWFDRPHNIVLGMLTTKGALGLASYIGIFLALFWVLWKGYRKGKLTFFAAFIPSVLAVTYFVQNLTVFDMPTSLMMFAVLLGFVAYTENIEKTQTQKVKHASYNIWMGTGLGIGFLVCLLIFVIQPFYANALIIKSLQTREPNQRLAKMEKCLQTSPMGKYQIRNFFAQNTQQMIQQVLSQNQQQKVSKEIVSKQLEFTSNLLEKTKRQSPMDYKSVLTLAQNYNLYSMFDSSKLKKAISTAKDAIEVAPTNPKAYWTLAQTQLKAQNATSALATAEKAVKLEPNLFRSHLIAVYAAQSVGGMELMQKKIAKAAEINPDWKARLYKSLGISTSTPTIKAKTKSGETVDVQVKPQQ